MKIWEKVQGIFGKRYLDWDEYEKIKNAKEEKAWQEAKSPRFRFRVSK